MNFRLALLHSAEELCDAHEKICRKPLRWSSRPFACKFGFHELTETSTKVETCTKCGTRFRKNAYI